VKSRMLIQENIEKKGGGEQEEKVDVNQEGEKVRR